MQRWPPFIVVYRVEATRPAQGGREGGDGSAWRRAIVLSRGAERSEGSNGGAGMGVKLKGVLSVRRWRGGELDRGRIKVAMRNTRASQRTLGMLLRVGTNRATSRSRRRTFGHVSLASRAGNVRLHRRAPGMGISAGAATGDSSVAASGDGTPQRTTANAMAQGGRHTCGHPCGAGW
jgi:hypothetical protein